MKKPFVGTAPLILTVLIVIFMCVIVAEQGGNSEISYTELISRIEAGEVKEVNLSSDAGTATVKLKNETEEKIEEKTVNIPDRNAFMLSIEDELRNNTVSVKEEETSVIQEMEKQLGQGSVPISKVSFDARA